MNTNDETQRRPRVVLVPGAALYVSETVGVFGVDPEMVDTIATALHFAAALRGELEIHSYEVRDSDAWVWAMHVLHLHGGPTPVVVWNEDGTVKAVRLFPDYTVFGEEYWYGEEPDFDAIVGPAELDGFPIALEVLEEMCVIKFEER